MAARNGHANIIKLLIETGGADVQERNMSTGNKVQYTECDSVMVYCSACGACGVCVMVYCSACSVCVMVYCSACSVCVMVYCSACGACGVCVMVYCSACGVSV